MILLVEPATSETFTTRQVMWAKLGVIWGRHSLECHAFRGSKTSVPSFKKLPLPQPSTKTARSVGHGICWTDVFFQANFKLMYFSGIFFCLLYYTPASKKWQVSDSAAKSFLGSFTVEPLQWRKGKWSPGQPPQKLRAQPLIEKEVIQA